jgi:hypothetical protein
VVSVNPTSGSVYGTTVDTTTVVYTIANGCGSNSVSVLFTVNPVSGIAAITGAGTICAGASLNLADATTGGSWSTTYTSIATVSSTGVVTGLSTGAAIITYTVITACGTASDTALVNVYTVPTVMPITGTTTICNGSTTTLSETATGGSWSSSAPGVATVSSTGAVTGLSAGTATITYSISGPCGSSATTVVTVNPLPATPTAISGSTTLCVGASTTLTSSPTGGTWSSTNTSVASVDGSGTFYAVAEFPHVPRPGIIRQRNAGLGVDALNGFAVFLR